MTKTEKETRRRGFVCQSCRGNGYSMRDLKVYKCSLCKATGGRRKFDHQNRNFALKEKKGELNASIVRKKKFPSQRRKLTSRPSISKLAWGMGHGLGMPKILARIAPAEI